MHHKGPVVNDLAYADNIIIFSSENKMSLELIMKQIKRYEKSSRQKVNTDKSFFLTDPKAGPSRIPNMRDNTGFMNKNFPSNYLGCPTYIGIKKIIYFDSMISKIIKRLSGWKSRILSPGGRLVLIKYVL